MSAIAGWLAREAMQAAMTDSSFRAGTMAVTEPAVAAVMGVPVAGGLCALVDIFSWMRKGRFPACTDWVSIAFDENPLENSGVGRPCRPGLGCGSFFDAGLTPKRGLHFPHLRPETFRGIFGGDRGSCPSLSQGS